MNLFQLKTLTVSKIQFTHRRMQGNHMCQLTFLSRNQNGTNFLTSCCLDIKYGLLASLIIAILISLAGMFFTLLFAFSYASYSVALAIIAFGAIVIIAENLKGIMIFSIIFALYWLANSITSIVLAFSDWIYQSIVNQYASAPDTSRDFLITLTRHITAVMNIVVVGVFTIYTLIFLFYLRRYYKYLKLVSSGATVEIHEP